MKLSYLYLILILHLENYNCYQNYNSRTSVPVILGQLLVQFQKQAIVDKPIHENRLNSTLKRTVRFILETNVKKDPESLYTFNDFFSYIWNDIYWLSSGVVVMTFLSCMLLHHTDLRQRVVGARMRIACCSLIYRKVRK